MRSPALVTSLALLVAVAAIGCSSADTTATGPGTTKKKTPTPTTETPTKNPKDDLPTEQTTPEAPAASGTEVGTETWSTGKSWPDGVTIKAGGTVTIDSGAAVTVGAGKTITIKGSLVVKTGATHAKISGMNWGGIVVAQGGSLNVDGLDIVDAAVGVHTAAGNTDATLLNSSILNSGRPFEMEPGSKLSITKSKVSGTGQSNIAGTFVASYMDYDKTSAEGLELNDPKGSMTISDSVLHGAGGGDYVVSRAGALVKVEYTTISGSHCGFHFNAVDKFIIDHVSEDVNSYSAMLYGSGAGPNQILSSNIRGTQVNLDFSGTNGATTIDKNYIGNMPNTLPAGTKITNPATVAIPDAKPR